MILKKSRCGAENKKRKRKRKHRDLLEETKERESTLRDQQLIEERRNAELQRLLEENNRKTAEVNRLQAANKASQGGCRTCRKACQKIGKQQVDVYRNETYKCY